MRPGAVNITYGGYFGLDPHDYDWTGLDVQETIVYASKYPGLQPTFDPVYMTFQDGFFATFGPPNVLKTSFSVVGNPSTYKWQWHPPIIPSTTAEDFIHFPAPSVYVLDRVDGYNYGLAYGYGTSHVAGTLDVDGDGWDHVYARRSYNVVGLPLGDSDTIQMLARRIVPADTDFTAQAQAHVQITPKLAGHGESVPNADGDPTGNGGFRVSISSNGYPLSLSSIHPGNLPAFEPFSLPQLGDDNYSNKFIYSGDLPALLRIPLAIRAQGARQDDMQWLVDNDKVGWKIDPAIDGWIPYTKLASNDEVIPVTNGENGVAMYQGLPDTDADFGLKTVILKVEGHESQQASIQTFFGATDYNHAGIDFTPNWFHFYNKIYQSLGLPTPNAFQYENGSTSHCDSDKSDPEPYHFPIVTGVYIDNDAYRSDVLPIFTPGLTYAGKLHVGGIHNFLYTVGHELGHKWDIENGLVNRKYRESDENNRGYDADGDGVLNSVEEANGLNPREQDTTGAYGGALEGDVEVLASIHGYAMLEQQKSLWKRDWSSAGLQYQGLDDSFWGPHYPGFASGYWGFPVATPYFPWNYERLFGPNDADPPWNAVDRVINPLSKPPCPSGKIPYPGDRLEPNPEYPFPPPGGPPAPDA